jgi:hypothetical protein
VRVSAALPLVSLNSSFASNSPVKLSNNGFGIGDLAWGPFYQSRIYKRTGRPALSWRFQLMILSPTGDFTPRTPSIKVAATEASIPMSPSRRCRRKSSNSPPG